MKDCSHDEAMADVFLADPAYAVELLAEVSAQGATDELLVLMRQLSTSVVSKDGASNDTSSKK